MAWALLKHNWFAPGGRRFRRISKMIPVEIPDDLVEFLPTTAVLLDDEGRPVDRVDHNLNKIAVPEGLRPAMEAAVKMEDEGVVADTISQFNEIRNRQEALAVDEDIEAARARATGKAGAFQEALAAEQKAAETEEAMAGQAPATVTKKVAEAKAPEKSKVRRAKDNRPPVMTAE